MCDREIQAVDFLHLSLVESDSEILSGLYTLSPNNSYFNDNGRDVLVFNSRQPSSRAVPLTSFSESDGI